MNRYDSNADLTARFGTGGGGMYCAWLCGHCNQKKSRAGSTGTGGAMRCKECTDKRLAERAARQQEATT